MPEFQLSHYPQVGIILQLARFTAENYRAGVSDAALTLEVATKLGLGMTDSILLNDLRNFEKMF